MLEARERVGIFYSLLFSVLKNWTNVVVFSNSKGPLRSLADVKPEAFSRIVYNSYLVYLFL